MVEKYYSRKTLYIKGDKTGPAAVLKGDDMWATELFTDTDGVRCADAVVQGRRLSIPLSYLTKAPPDEQPPHEELSASGGAGAGPGKNETLADYIATNRI